MSPLAVLTTLAASVAAPDGVTDNRVADSRAKVMAAIAQEVVQRLDIPNKTRAIRIVRFTVDGGLKNVNYGMGVADDLYRSLKATGVAFRDDADVVLTGEVTVVQGDVNAPGGKANNLLFVKVQPVVKCGSSDTSKLPAHFISDPGVVLEVAGTSATVVASADKTDQTAGLTADLKKPEQPYFAGTIIRRTPASPYGVEIRVKRGSEYIPLTPRWDGSMVQVPLAIGDKYVIYLYSFDAMDAAYRVGIDGLDVFCRYVDVPGQQTPSYLLVSRGGTSQREPEKVRGYVNSPLKSEEFEVSAYAHSLAAAPGRDGRPAVAADWLKPVAPKTGTIVVKVAPAWNEGETPKAADIARGGARGTSPGACVDTPRKVITKMVGDFNTVIVIGYSN